MNRADALARLAQHGLRGREAQSSLDAMLIRVGFSSKTIDRTIAVARTMTTQELVSYFGMDGSRAAIILSRNVSSR